MIRSAHTHTHTHTYIYIRGKEKELFYKKRRLESGIKAVISKSKDGYHNFFSYAISPGKGSFGKKKIKQKRKQKQKQKTRNSITKAVTLDISLVN